MQNIPAVQVISKIINTGDYSIVIDNELETEYFIGYENEIEFISKHYAEYKNVPDGLTFIDKFPGFVLCDVSEQDEYLVNELKQKFMDFNTANIINDSRSEGSFNSDDLADKLKALSDSVNKGFEQTALYASINDRIERADEVSQNLQSFFLMTGFAEIDKDINGLQRGSELAVIYARTNNGKTWVAEAMANFIAETGHRVGYFSPEMSPTDLGYRVDALHGHLSNNAVRLGRFTDEFTLDDYRAYGEELKKIRGDIFVTTPKSFKRKVTVSKIRRWIEKSDLDVVFIDGIKYMTDERRQKSDNVTTALTNISEDLMDLSSEMRVPIVIVVQANRGGVVDKNSLDTPELENIRDSDGIAQNASLVWAVRKIVRGDETFLLIDNKKARNGENGQSYKYKWEVDTGKFEYVSIEDMPIDDREDESYSEKRSTIPNKRKRRSLEDEM